jgi:ligand-binding SRPBCC domain-containing protein
MVERRTVNPQVPGSSPGRGATIQEGNSSGTGEGPVSPPDHVGRTGSASDPLIESRAMKRVRFSSSIPVPATELYSWHAREGAFERLVPPWQNVEIVSRDGSIRDGDVLRMKLRLGPLSKTWIAVHDSHIEGEQFRDTQVTGPFHVWKHVHRMHAESSQSCILEDDVTYEVPFERIIKPFAAPLIYNEIRRMFRFRHLRTRLDLQQHEQFRHCPRISFALEGSHPFALQLRAFLTGGGHNEVEASDASILIDLRALAQAESPVLRVYEGQHVISLYPGDRQHTPSANLPGQTYIAVPPQVIGPSFSMSGLSDVVRAAVASHNVAQDWIAEDDLIWLIHGVALDPGRSPDSYGKTFATQDVARRYFMGRL